MTRRTALLLVLLLAGAALLRGVGIHRGAPELQPDETIMVEGAGAVVEGMRPDTVLGWPGTPQLFALSTVFALDFAVRRGSEALRGDPGEVLDRHYAEFYREPGRWYLLDRLVTLILGVASVLLVFHLGRRHFGGDLAGFVAAAALAANFLHVRFSRLVLPDVPMTFLWILSVHLLLRGAGDSGRTRLGWAAFVAGLAAATKLNAGPLLLFVPLTAWFVGDAGSTPRWRRFLLASAAGLAGLLIGCPYLVSDLPLVAKDVVWRNLYQQGIEGRAGGGYEGNGWWFLIRTFATLRYGLVPAVLLIPGLLFVAFRRVRANLVAGGLLLFYLLLLGFSQNLSSKWLIPAIPLICLLGGGAFAALMGHPRLRREKARAALAVVVGLVILAGGARSAMEASELLEPLPREELASWVEENVEDGETIAVEFYAEAPFPLCREALEERCRELSAALAAPSEARPDVPVFLLPAVLNEERFELQKARHLLREATDRGYRVLQVGTDDRYRRFLAAVESGKVRVFVFDQTLSYNAKGGGREGELARDREALRRTLEKNATKRQEIGSRYLVYSLTIR